MATSVIIGTVHVTDCACGGHLATNVGEKGYADAVRDHQQTDRHRKWADGPAFRQWQENDGTTKGQNREHAALRG